MKCNSDLTDDKTVCCHSEQINTPLPAQMNGFAVFFPDQVLLEYNDSQYQVETFVTADFGTTGLNKNGQILFEATGYTANLNLRFLRFGIQFGESEATTEPLQDITEGKNKTTTEPLPDVIPTMINIIAVTVPPILVVLIFVLLIIIILVLAIKLQRKKRKKTVTKLTEEEGFDNTNC